MKTNKKDEKHILSKFQYLICYCFTFLFLFSGNKGLLGLGEFNMNNPFRLNAAIAEPSNVNEDIINRVIHFLTQEQEIQETVDNEGAKSDGDVYMEEDIKKMLEKGVEVWDLRIFNKWFNEKQSIIKWSRDDQMRLIVFFLFSSTQIIPADQHSGSSYHSDTKTLLSLLDTLNRISTKGTDMNVKSALAKTVFLVIDQIAKGYTVQKIARMDFKAQSKLAQILVGLFKVLGNLSEDGNWNMKNLGMGLSQAMKQIEQISNNNHSQKLFGEMKKKLNPDFFYSVLSPNVSDSILKRAIEELLISYGQNEESAVLNEILHWFEAEGNSIFYNYWDTLYILFNFVIEYIKPHQSSGVNIRLQIARSIGEMRNEKKLKELYFREILKTLATDNKIEVNLALVEALKKILESMKESKGGDQKLSKFLTGLLKKMSEHKIQKVKNEASQALTDLGYEVVKRKILGIHCGNILSEPQTKNYRYPNLL